MASFDGDDYEVWICSIRTDFTQFLDWILGLFCNSILFAPRIELLTLMTDYHGIV